MRVKFVLIFVLITFFSQNIFPLQKGSEGSVTVEPLAIFPAADNDNKMVAFGWFKNGFLLEDNTTSCTFESVFPVSGSVVFNGGSLYLNSDLHFANVTTITSVGKIYGQNHIVEIDSSVERIFNTNQDMHFKDIDFFLHSDLQISTTVIFEGACYLNGRDRSIMLDSDVEILVANNSTLTIKNLKVEDVSRNQIRCINNSGKIILDNVEIVLDGDYSFTTGKLEVINSTDFSGTYSFFYDCLSTITVHENSQLRFSDDVTFVIGLNETLNKDRIVFLEDNTSKICFDNSHLNLGSSGIIIKKGILLLRGGVNLSINSTDISNGLILGDGTLENDPELWYMPATMVNFLKGHLNHNIVNPYKCVSKSKYSKLIRDAQSVFYMATDHYMSNLTIKLDPLSGLLTGDGVTVHYVNCKLIMPGVKFSITGSRYNAYTSLLDGGQEVFLEEGTLELYFLIMNGSNLIRGNGSLSGLINLYNSDAELYFDLDGSVLNNIDLSSGKIILSHDLEFGNNVTLLSTGTVNLVDKDLSFGSQDLNWTSTIYWDGDYGRININSNVYLSSNWTISGNCIIHGNNNILYLKPTGSITLEKGSTLEFKNIRLGGLGGNNVRCLDSAGKIIFDTVKCKLLDDYYFEDGSFEVDYKWDVKGSYTFYYQSDQVSTIKHCSTLTFFPDSTFSYSTSIANNHLINLQTDESILELDCATLHSTQTGLHLTGGKFRINGKCCLKSDATCKAEAVCFGDGVNSSNDLELDVFAESTLEVASGCLCYKNLN
ncbi:hypothetical protein ACFLYH_02300 [Candidatus Dependentiae bacterium]